MDTEEVGKRLELFQNLIEKDSRSDKLNTMYEAFADQLALAPASGKHHYHNAFPGGYVDHVVRVAEMAVKQAKLWEDMGGTIDFTRQELIFAALHHDLGKLGTEDTPYYVEQDSDWHRKRGELYKFNEALPYWKVTDRALFILQKYEIPITDKEWLAIKLSDGLYDDANKSYLINYMPYPMHTVLPRIIHVSDYLACQLENDKTRF
jgi:hypothetical protein